MARSELTNQKYLDAVQRLSELAIDTEVEAQERVKKLREYHEYMHFHPSEADIWIALFERYGNICGSAKVYLAKGLLTPEIEAKSKADLAAGLDHIFGPNKPPKVIEFQELISRSWQTSKFYLVVESWLESYRQLIIAERTK